MSGLSSTSPFTPIFCLLILNPGDHIAKETCGGFGNQMMSCTQANVFFPNVKLGVPCRPPSQSYYSHHSFLDVSAIYRCGNYCNAFPRLVCGSSNYRQFDPICLGSGNLKSGNEVFPRSVKGLPKFRRFVHICMAKGNAEKGNEGFSWESLKNAMGGFGKEESVQDWVKKQMRENEFDGGGDDGGRPRGGGDASGDEEDEGFSGILDELLQVFLATIGFIFVYIYLIRGAELTRLARDYIKYLFGASASMRLGRAMDKWARFCENITRTDYVRDDWLERAIVLTPTWWHDPGKIARIMRSRDDVDRFRVDDDDEDDKDN